MVNSISRMETQVAESSSTLLSTTLFLSFAVVGYSLYYIKQKIEDLITTKKDIDEEEQLDENLYQSWEGVFADGNDSLRITIVREKYNSKKKNNEWIDWDERTDPSVVSRNFYLGNMDPSFEWKITKRDNDTEVVVRDTLTDGWNSLVHLILKGFLKEEVTSEQMNKFLKKLIQEEKIEWTKTLTSDNNPELFS